MSKIFRNEKPALFIAGLYLIIGLAWIYLSDRIQPLWFNEPDKQLLFQTIKGGFYVVVTALLLFSLISKQIYKRNGLIQLLKNDNYTLYQILDTNLGLDFIIIDKTGEVVFTRGNGKIWSDRNFEKIKGLNIINNPLTGFDAEAFRTFYKNIWARGESFISNIEISGNWYEMQGFILKDEDATGNMNNLALVVFKDVTRVKKLELELKLEKAANDQKNREISRLLNLHQAVNERIKTVLDNLYNGIVVFSVEFTGTPGVIKDINRAARNILGFKSDDMDGNRLKEFINFESEDDELMVFKNDFRQKKQVVVKAHVAGLNNETKPIELICRYLNMPNEPVIIFIIRDIQKESEVPVNNLNIDFRSVLNGFAEGVMLLKADGNCFFINSYMKQLLNMDSSSEVETTPSDLITFGEDIDMSKYVERCLLGEIVNIPHYQLPKFEKRKFGSTLFPLKNKDGSIGNILRIVRDLTSVYELEKIVHDQKKSVEESTKLRTVFLSNLSHEIRTPMNGIIGFVDLLENEDLDENQKRYLLYIRQSCNNLLGMLNSLIEISQLENKGIPVTKSWVTFKELLAHIEPFITEEINKVGKNNLKIKVDVPDGLELEKIYTDTEKVVGIWKLILNNAIKFTHQGIIETGLGITENGNFEFWVSDTGVGIKAFNLKAIFLPFATFNNTGQLIFGGLGLGLPIAKGYVELLGGEIFVETKENEGSKFIVSIPLKNVGGIKLGEKNQKVILEKIMIIQHGVDSVQDICENLESFGVNVIHVQSGAMAIEKLMDHQDIDMVICDTRLSDMNGLEFMRVAKRIRPGIPIVAQSSYFIPDERKQYMDTGFIDYVVKPINKSLLFSWVKGQ